MLIRPEREDDHDAVYAVNAAAFQNAAEAKLVTALRARVHPLISLVAEAQSEIVGHILFSPVSLSTRPELLIFGLAPMAVAPGRQRTGIGSALVQAGLERCRELEGSAVVVLGHPDYYPKFGFTAAIDFGLSSEYEVPDDVFMALELQPDVLGREPGLIKYAEEFASA